MTLKKTKYSSDWKLIYFLIILTSISTFLTIVKSQNIGTYSYWSMLFFVLTIYLIKGKDWNVFLVLVTAFGSLSVFQAGTIVGYNIWYYVLIPLAILLTFRRGIDYMSLPGFKWWLFLLLLGSIHLILIESEMAFEYSFYAVVRIGAGLSLLGVGYQVAKLREYRDAITQVTFLVMSVCTISLVVPFMLSQDFRLGEEIDMDANGLGISAIYAFLSCLIYLHFNRSIKSVVIVCLIISFLVVVLIQTGSRQAISTSILLLGLFAFFSLRNRVRLRYLVILLSISASLAFFVSEGQLAYVEERFSRTFGAEREIDRIDHLRVSLHMVAEHPLGLGGGGFRENFNEYKYKAGVRSIFTNIQPHTLFGMVMADWGLPGIFLLIGGFFALSKFVLKLKEESFVVGALALFAFFALSNTGTSFMPVLLGIIGLNRIEQDSATRKKRIVW